jgi:magnesium transporter
LFLAEEMANEVSQIQENIKATQRVVEMSLDAGRNRVLRLNLQIGMFSIALSSGSLIAAIFGMNLNTGLEVF